jgi:hypothetical protein
MQGSLVLVVVGQLAGEDRLELAPSIAVQNNASEGTVLGHIDTALGRHAVIDRAMNVIAAREIPGAELVLGQVLGVGIGR